MSILPTICWRKQRLFPSFKKNDKSLSVIHALAESLPYWVRKSFWNYGSIELATKEISIWRVTQQRQIVF